MGSFLRQLLKIHVGEPIAQLGERRTLDRKVAGSILTRGAVLCP